MNKKLLIYMPIEKLKPTGGPAGYLYNLYKELSIKNVKNVNFLEQVSNKENYRSVYNKLPNSLKNMYRIIYRKKEYNNMFKLNKLNSKIANLNDYDYIHFHSTKSLYNARKSLNEFRGKIILTSHSPKPLHLEVIEDQYTKLERLLYGKKHLKTFKNMDKYSFDRADYIVFPCEDAEEPYYNNWDEYSDIKMNNKSKYRYLLSGTRECTAKNTRKDILKKYGIPEDAFVISYVGRHNEVKGYGDLKAIGNEILSKNKDIYFLIAGQEKPLTRLKHDRWIEVGWTNDPHSIISASNLFILPNKETYFDLVMLEVLSLGKIVIASNTGGNKLFKKINAEGILIYDNIQDAIKLISRIKELSIDEKNYLESRNKKLFKENFTNEIFCNNYIELINGLD